MYYKLNKKSDTHSNGDGYITKDGHTMFQKDIVRDLNRMKSHIDLLKAEIAQRGK